jgi:hypothetical protein
MARYLDPQSKRIQDATESDRHAANAWFKANNPFRLPREGSEGSHPAISSDAADFRLL